MDFTGTGNSLNVVHPSVLRLIMDSLRYWVIECHVDGFRFDLASALARELYDVDRLSRVLRRDPPGPGPLPGQAHRRALGRRARAATRSATSPCCGREWNGIYRDVDARLLARRRPASATSRRASPAPSDLYERRRPQPVRVDQLHHRPRRLHARRPRRLQREAQRGQQGGQPRRHRRQPVLELRRRGPDRRPGDQRAARPPAAQLPDDAHALAGRADAPRRRRARPHPGRQQQRLVPGQRDLLVRLGHRRGGQRPPRLHAAAHRPAPARTPSSAAATSSAATTSEDSGLPDVVVVPHRRRAG